MRSPIVAMLWENWRLTRVEAALRFALGIVAGSAALLMSGAGATVAFWILITLHGMCVWFSILKLNGGKFMDGYKPGFPFYLLYARPVPTVVFVGATMAYDAISCAALYLLSAALLEFAFRQPLPLFSVTVWIAACHFCYLCVQWSTSNRVVQWIGSAVFLLPLFLLLRNRVASPLQVEFSLIENALMVLIVIVAFGLTVAGVARQRSGGTVAPVHRTAGSGGYPNWLITLFRFRCPTSSATRAQVWFELQSSGLPVLAIGLAFAILISLLFAISIPVTFARPVAQGVAIFLAPAALLVLCGNAFGIRRRQGRAYTSTFEATQPYGTAQMAGLKVLVRSICLLAAMIAVGVSVWVSSSFISAWGPWLLDGKDASQGMLGLRHEIGDAIGGLTGYVHAALAVVASVFVAVTVASLAAFTAIRARYSRRVNIAISLLLLCGLALVLLVLAGQSGIASEFLVDALFTATRWIAAAAMVCGTVYLAWRAVAEQLLMPRHVYGAILIWAACGAAWLTLAHAGGLQIAAMTAEDTVSLLWRMFLPLMACVVAPWSLSRIRHI